MRLVVNPYIKYPFFKLGPIKLLSCFPCINFYKDCSLSSKCKSFDRNKVKIKCENIVYIGTKCIILSI